MYRKISTAMKNVIAVRLWARVGTPLVGLMYAVSAAHVVLLRCRLRCGGGTPLRRSRAGHPHADTQVLADRPDAA
jgi:hypothetical protein